MRAVEFIIERKKRRRRPGYAATVRDLTVAMDTMPATAEKAVATGVVAKALRMKTLLMARIHKIKAMLNVTV